MNRIRIRLQTSLLVIAFLIASAVGPSGPAPPESDLLFKNGYEG